MVMEAQVRVIESDVTRKLDRYSLCLLALVGGGKGVKCTYHKKVRNGCVIL
jgi:hypothetical protein